MRGNLPEENSGRPGTMHSLLQQFGDFPKDVLQGWVWLTIPAILMVLGILRRVTSPIPSRKPTFGRD
jgi:hypothetical protein